MQLPGRAINSNRKIVVTRRLPVPGEVLVQRGQRVEPLQVIARAELIRRYQVVDVARQLARPQVEMSEVLLKAEGSPVEANEPIASSQGGLPFLRRVARAPAAGYVAAIGPGWVLLETEQTTIELQAFVHGVVSKIITNRGAIIETNGAIITANCGFGGEAYGSLKRLVNAPFETLEPDAIDDSAENSILLGGRSVDEEVLRVAQKAQVRGIIVGSIDGSLMHLTPPSKVRVVATEGFGDLPMSPYTFGILATLAGKEVAIRGNTPALFPSTGRGDGDDPPIIMTTTAKASSQAPPSTAAGESETLTVNVGSRVRVTRGRLLGNSGLINSIPTEPQATESGVIAPVAQVKIEESLYYIPWANLERID